MSVHVSDPFRHAFRGVARRTDRTARGTESGDRGRAVGRDPGVRAGRRGIADGRWPVDPEALERSIAAQVALACRVSPTEGRRRVRTARDLHAGHTRVRELFSAGLLSEYKTATVIAATAHLSPAERAQVDQELAEQRVETLGVRRIHDLARTLAAQVAPEKFTARCRAARSGRRVSVRPSADGMADLTAHLPVEEAVACYAALAAAVNEVAVQPEPVTRGRGQIMADTLVERLTGQATARDVAVEIQILVPVEALVDRDSPLPAEIPGHGPVPVELLTCGAGRKTWRRLITRDGTVIGGDSRSRFFTGRLAALIRARDGHRCREPYCDAPIRHIDHIRRWSELGRTEFDNGRGLCAFHNHVRETVGWRAEVTSGTVRTTTPTGAEYVSELLPLSNPATGEKSRSGAA
ncbi:HNH endonuclease [Pseudonocardia broussonetiae]|uniref:HNH endonuclease n=1 Tax=Pseudonocardia broussonetiae TaxID=2736640 RepID=UPI001F037D92|nr:HNH endonuclease signature motif containing protein [Pseudonocardia broussonetiae]